MGGLLGIENVPRGLYAGGVALLELRIGGSLEDDDSSPSVSPQPKTTLWESSRVP